MTKKKKVDQSKAGMIAALSINRGQRYTLYRAVRLQTLEIVFEHLSYRQFIVLKKIIERKNHNH